MIRFTLRTLLKSKALWAWPAVFLLFAGVFLTWGGISSAQNSYSFILNLGEINIPAGMVLMQVLSVTVLVTIIGLPTHFGEILKPERASLLLSKPISRAELFFSDIASVLVFSLGYTLISVIMLAALTLIGAGIFPFQLFISFLLFLPLLILSYYITILLFLMLTNSYLGSVILGYFVTEFSSLFLGGGSFLQMLGFDGTVTETIFSILSYLIPSAAGFEQIMQGIFESGFSSLDGGLLLFTLVSCLPMLFLGYYFFQKKQF